MNLYLNSKSASLGLIVGCVLFGLGSIIVSTVSLGAYAVAFWRLIIASAIFYTIVKYFNKSLPTNKKAKFYAALSGFFLAYDLALWHESIYAIGPGISTLLNSLQIFWLSFIGCVLYNEKQGALGILSLILATLGVALIAYPELNSNTNAIWGFIAGIGSGGCLAISMLFVKKSQEAQKISIFSLMFILSISGAISLLPVSIIIDSLNFFPKNFKELGLVFIYGAIMQCVAWGLIAYCVPLLSLSLTGLLLLSEPVAALLIDAFLLDKFITKFQWLGAAITMFAIYLGSIKNKKQRLKGRKNG
ncbi:DMT family transporter [Campylobacter sp. RM12920]|uniref:DMT family transporter n=1 Tax=Campylobacter californiensis TaxID=1032243 RepID=A0ABD4JKF9_9BACT|nr:DMT family transporter [Campylobacter sp. RM12919]MBE2988859.1 DMT family transporter [Campylobacter sp. RM12920]